MARRKSNKHAHRSNTERLPAPTGSSEITQLRIGSLFEDDANKGAGDIHTEDLHEELDSFRQKWKRELVAQQDEKLADDDNPSLNTAPTSSRTALNQITQSNANEQNRTHNAKRLFLTGVQLEEDGLYPESIRYYKQATDMCPDVESRVFKDQCQQQAQASTPSNTTGLEKISESINRLTLGGIEYQSLIDLVRANHQSTLNITPSVAVGPNTAHISCLPYEIILRIVKCIIGDDIDLASLESFGSVCRGFFLASREQSIWRTLCLRIWGDIVLNRATLQSSTIMDWRRFFIETPRLNFDGVYISETKYIRFGDVGFQDINYRPFHIVRYYRYLRFMPNNSVLILMTNEEPSKIKPLFRQARDLKQFSPELSVMQGTYKLKQNSLSIVAEKKYSDTDNASNAAYHRRRNRQWPSYTPLSRKFLMDFELSSGKNLKLFRNGRLKWVSYSILTRRVSDQETDTFDLTSDEFPDLFFSKIKRISKVSD